MHKIAKRSRCLVWVFLITVSRFENQQPRPPCAASPERRPSGPGGERPHLKPAAARGLRPQSLRLEDGGVPASVGQGQGGRPGHGPGARIRRLLSWASAGSGPEAGLGGGLGGRGSSGP